MRAFERCDELRDQALLKLSIAVALEKHAKVAQVAPGWTPQGVAVAVQVNVPMPTPEERAEMRSLDAKLDAFAKLIT